MYRRIEAQAPTRNEQCAAACCPLVLGPLRVRSGARHLGFRDGFIEEGSAGVSMPASEWLCRFTRDVAPGALASLANMAGWLGALTIRPPGHWMAGLDLVVRFHGTVVPDGRGLHGTSSGVAPGAGNVVVAPQRRG